MQFDSLAFIAFFLAIVGLYWSVSSWVWRKNLLLLASYLFYAGWNPYFLPLLIVTSFLDWRLALLMAQAPSVRSRKAWLAAICVVNLSVLAYFKYANFLIDNTNALVAMVGIPQWGFQSSIALPIGISFYTFHSLSYCIDVCRGNVQPTRSWRDYLLYVAFFPQLVAGPIVRWTAMGHQIETPRPFRPDYLGLGVALMVVGLFQKIVLADGIFAPVADAHFGQASLESGLSAWVGALAFTGQIFCDFAGYTTCAIGAALALGFQLPVNFQAPYAALGFSDFWQRWHISLSSWLRDYLYIPLGGNRGHRIATARNLVLTMFLGGLWHGAAWTFVVWGLLHGVFLVAERLFTQLADFLGLSRLSVPRLRAVLGWLATFIAVVTAWVFFRAEDLSNAMTMVMAMYSAVPVSKEGLAVLSYEDGVAVLALGIIVVQQVVNRNRPLNNSLRAQPWPVLGVTLGCMLLLISLSSGQTNAFIYFQF